jgi:hypothetical protein
MHEVVAVPLTVYVELPNAVTGENVTPQMVSCVNAVNLVVLVPPDPVMVPREALCRVTYEGLS